MLNTNEIIPSAASGALAALTRSANDYAVAAHGAGTRRAYSSGWQDYVAWCAEFGREPLGGDPVTVALYATRSAAHGHTVATIRVRMAAIRQAHRVAHVPLDMADERLVSVLEGIARTHGTAARRKATAATPAELRPMVASRAPASTAAGARDRAMLLIGFGAALRRSELVALQVQDVQVVPGRGLRITIRRSKTDQEGAGRTVAISANPLEPDFCALRAFEAWMSHRRNARDGGGPDKPLFCGAHPTRPMSGQALCDKTVARLVKDSAEAAGLDPAMFSGHSLRRGFLTAAANGGASLHKLMSQSRHKSVEVAMGYIDEADEWNGNASGIAFGFGRAA